MDLYVQNYKNKETKKENKSKNVFVNNVKKKISNKYNLEKHLKICPAGDKQQANQNKKGESLENIRNNDTVVNELQINESNDITITDHYIYIIHVREFIITNETIYKIGKKTQKNFDRFFQYFKGSKLLFYMKCKNCHNLENKVIKLFKNKYKLKSEYGKEYFEGNYLFMVNDIVNLILKEK